MLFKELLEFPNNTPVKTKNGIGLLIRWSEQNNEIGIQIPGENNITWINTNDMVEKNKMLYVKNH